MDIVLIGLQAPLFSIAVLLGSYVLVITLAPAFFSGESGARVTRKLRYVFVVPAHNEEKVLAGTLESIRQIDYPPEIFDIVVVADNCTDATAQIAEIHGATVFERHDPAHRGKGYALNWIIPRLLDSHKIHDAFLFVDADSLVSRNFLEEMNRSLAEGHRVVQSSDLVLDNTGNWRVQLMLLAFALQNYVRPLGRTLLGFSAGLKGNGMCFSREILGSVPWNNESLGEDTDMGLELIRRGISIRFNPKAVVYAQMPMDAMSAATQRMRWEGGRFATIRGRIPGLLVEAWRKRNWLLLEAVVDAAFPPLAIFGVFATLFLGLNAFLLRIGSIQSTVGIWAWGIVLACLAIHCGLGLLLSPVRRASLLALRYLPVYVAWKLAVYFRMFRSQSGKEWIRTAR